MICRPLQISSLEIQIAVESLNRVLSEYCFLESQPALCLIYASTRVLMNRLLLRVNRLTYEGRGSCQLKLTEVEILTLRCIRELGLNAAHEVIQKHVIYKLSNPSQYAKKKQPKGRAKRGY